MKKRYIILMNIFLFIKSNYTILSPMNCSMTALSASLTLAALATASSVAYASPSLATAISLVGSLFLLPTHQLVNNFLIFPVKSGLISPSRPYFLLA